MKIKLCVIGSLLAAATGQLGAAKYERHGEVACLEERLLVPEKLEQHFSEYERKYPTGELALEFLPICGEPFPSYAPGRPAAFFWRMGENRFYFYCDSQGGTSWHVLSGRNVLDPGIEGISVEFAVESWVSPRLRRDLNLVVKQLPQMEVPDILRLLEYYEEHLPGPALSVQLASSLKAACWELLAYPQSRCVRREREYPPQSVSASIHREGRMRVVNIWRDGELLYRKTTPKFGKSVP